MNRFSLTLAPCLGPASRLHLPANGELFVLTRGLAPAEALGEGWCLSPSLSHRALKKEGQGGQGGPLLAERAHGNI